jgi:hypothetical protein
MIMRMTVLKIAVIANAILLVGAFVGCPWRRDPQIVPPTISPPTDHFHIAPPPSHSDFVPPTISPPTDHFERVLPPAGSGS